MASGAIAEDSPAERLNTFATCDLHNAIMSNLDRTIQAGKRSTELSQPAANLRRPAERAKEKLATHDTHDLHCVQRRSSSGPPSVMGTSASGTMGRSVRAVPAPVSILERTSVAFGDFHSNDTSRLR
jgi:hypothetical protein